MQAEIPRPGPRNSGPGRVEGKKSQTCTLIYLQKSEFI
jgi:hypothetical protein